MTQQNDYIPFLNRSICHIILGNTDLALSNQSLLKNSLNIFYGSVLSLCDENEHTWFLVDAQIELKLASKQLF